MQDRVPPVVSRVEPDTFAVVEPGLERLRVWFSERISEQTSEGALDGAVQITPEVPGLEVSHRRDGLDIKVPGGLRPGVAYAVRIRPVVRDLFNNAMVAPFEWVVSTGGAPVPNALVGQVWDRITGEALPDIRIVAGEAGHEALGDTASATALRFATLSGEEGIYALRYLPEGPLSVLAFQDRNRNRYLDEGEPRGLAGSAVGPADTVFLSLSILAPDTTAPALARAVPLDSSVVRLFFDDALDPLVALDGLELALRPDTLPPADSAVAPAQPGDLPAVREALHEHRWAELRDSLVAAADSAFRLRVEDLLAAGDTVRADSLRSEGAAPVPGGDDRGPERPGGGGRPSAGALLPDGTPLPSNTLVLILDGSLPPGAPVLIRVEGAVNVNGLGQGGGEARVLWEVPEAAPDSAVAPDSAAVPDSAGAVPDTAGVSLPSPVSTPGGPAPSPRPIR
jgi:hypothetical protein